MSVPVVIDTDLGNNIDDAFALSLAAVSPEISLLGVTTTWFQSSARALIARRLLGAWGRTDVPVSVGHHPRYEAESYQNHTNFTLGRMATVTPPLAPSSKTPAFHWLKHLLLNERQQITYVANAPLTNLAHLLSEEPSCGAFIDRVVLMGGWASQALPEWNVVQDPSSALVVLRSGIPITTIGYEVTLNSILSARDVRALYGSNHAGTHFLMRLYDTWRHATGETPPVMYDPLTVAAIIDPSLIRCERRQVNVQTAEGPAYGVMYEDPDHGIAVASATSVDRKGYLELLVSRLTKTDRPRRPALPAAPALPRLTLREGLEIDYYAGWALPDQRSSTHILAVVAAGAGVVRLNDQPEECLATGDLVYIGYDDTYRLSTETGMSLSLVSFDAWPDVTDEVGEASPSHSPMRRLFDLPHVFGFNDDTESAGNLLKRIVYSWRRPSMENMLQAHGLLMRLLSVLLRLHNRDDERTDAGQRDLIHQAKSFMEHHVEGDVNLDDVSAHVGVSKYHLIRLFKETDHMTPMTYYRLLKMRRARSLLELSSLAIKEIAWRLGYSSPAVFSRAFRTETGMSPGEYRRMVQTQAD